MGSSSLHEILLHFAVLYLFVLFCFYPTLILLYFGVLQNSVRTLIKFLSILTIQSQIENNFRINHWLKHLKALFFERRVKYIRQILLSDQTYSTVISCSFSFTKSSLTLSKNQYLLVSQLPAFSFQMQFTTRCRPRENNFNKLLRVNGTLTPLYKKIILDHKTAIKSVMCLL